MIYWLGQARKKGYEDDMSMFVDLYVAQGKSLDDIATMFNVNRNTVRNKVLQLGIPMRPRGGKHHHATPLNISYEEYMEKSYKELATQYKVSTATVYNQTRCYPRKRPILRTDPESSRTDD